MALNDFESGRRKAIPAVLIYASCAGERLMLHRDSKRPNDHHEGKWNGLGGKCEADESPLEAARRELKEESGIQLAPSAFKALGVLQFPNFKPAKAEDWIVFVFSAEVDPGLKAPGFDCPEGTLHWVAEKDLLGLPLWEGDRLFLPLVLKGRSFMGTVWYEGGTVARHWLEAL